jgi:hypothetical protein
MTSGRLVDLFGTPPNAAGEQFTIQETGRTDTEMEHQPPQTFVVAGQTRHLTSYDRPSPKSGPKNIPPAVKRLVAELGLRYRPSAQADLEAHAATLALLASDLADIPPHHLERAIAKHVLSSPYLPKASDLISIAQSFVNQTPGAHGPVGETMAQRGNRMMPPEMQGRMTWHDDGSGGAYLA